jgi:uncharacterized protein
MSRELNLHDIDDLARGAAILGCGGGGDPYIGALMTKQAFADGLPVTLVDPSEVPDGAHVVCIFGIGAPPVLIEKIVSREQPELALRHLERHIGRKAEYLIAVEVGGLNALSPLMLGAVTGLPVIDGDGMGRCFPKLEMTTFNIAEVLCTPLAVVNERGDFVLLKTESDAICEHYIRYLSIGMGGFMTGAGFAQSGAEVKRACVPGTLSICLKIGQVIRQARERKDNVFTALLAGLRETEYYRHAHIIFEGRISDVSRRITGRHSVGVARIERAGEVLELVVQNEFLVARKNGETVCIVPDLITLLDEDSGEAITAELLRYGQRVKVLATSAPPIMRSAAALAIWGPHAFGLDEPFVPIEQLVLRG